MLPHLRRAAAIAATLTLTLAPVALRAQTLPAPAQAAPVAVSAQPTSAMSAQARAAYDALAGGNVDRSQFSSDIEGLDDGTVSAASQRLQARGPVTSFAFQRALRLGDETVYVYRVSSANAPDLLELISWDTDGKIARFMIGPAP